MFDLECDRPWLTATFATPQRMVSWSLNRPGFVDASAVAWLEVADGELRDVSDVNLWFRERLAQAGRENAVGLITARNVARFERIEVSVEEIAVDCVVTLGLNNGEHVGQRVHATASGRRSGTINLLCAISAPLTDAALLEASSIAAQARTVALLECGYRRPGQTQIVTGTGTDCIVVTAPRPSATSSALDYAGMHTETGEAVGAAVRKATMAAADAWRTEWEERLLVAAERDPGAA